MATSGGVIRRKLNVKRAEPPASGPGADRGWRNALARAARDHLKTQLEVSDLTLARVGLAEVLETPPDRALLIVLEGPCEGLGVLAIAPEVLSAMVEVLTIGRVGATGAPPRKPTRTDAALLAPMIDAALTDLEASLAEEVDLVWAGGWRYASFLDDPRPLGLMLEDVPYRVLQTVVSVGSGARRGNMILALPAEGRGQMPVPTLPPVDEAAQHLAFSAALTEGVEGAAAQLEAVLTRLAMPLSRVASLAPGDVLPLTAAALDRVSLEGLDGRKIAEGKLGQNRGMRALRLAEGAGAARTPVAPSAPIAAALNDAADIAPSLRQSA